jgi:putative ABC transport system permease protein
MPLLPRLASLWRNIRHGNRVEQEIGEEVDAYLEMLTEAKIKEGLKPAEARRAAMMELGGMEQVKERVREVRMGQGLDRVRQDLRYGVRMMAKHRGMTCVAVLTLALGIGANTAIFSVINAVLLGPLPYQDPDRLVYLWTIIPPRAEPMSTSFPDFLDWSEQQQVFEGIAAGSSGGSTLTGGDEPYYVQTASVSANLFQLLRVGPILGRSFLAEDEEWGRNRVVILSHGLWQRQFGGGPDILGRPIQLDGVAFTVVGILPAGFEPPIPNVELWRPLALAPDNPTRAGRNTRLFTPLLARLKPGVTVEQADQELKSIAYRLAQAYPQTNGQVSATVISMAEWNTRPISRSLWVLLGAVGFVLLIACINTANLLLAQSTAREKELGIRIALGASRRRLLCQLLTESGLLALLGGGAGLLLAYWGLKAIVTFGPNTIPRLEQTRIDIWVLGFTLSTSLLSGVLFGLIPAWRASRSDPYQPLKESGRSMGESRNSRRLLQALVVSEVALALVLLVGAGLLVRSFASLQGVDPGFNPDNTLAVQIRLPRIKYQGREARFFDELLGRLKGLPQVKAAGAGSFSAFPLRGSRQTTTFGLEGQPVPLHEEDKERVGWRQVTSDYFEALGIRLRAGRFFSAQDRPQSLPVAIINESLARRYFPDQDPVGSNIWIDDELQLPLRVVGVVGDAKFEGLDNPDFPSVYTSHLQEVYFVWPSMWIAMRAEAEPLSLVSAVREQVKALDKDLSLPTLTTLEGIVSDSLSERRFNLFLLGALALVALVMAAVGIYGVMAQAVSRRTHEIGIRMALGARAVDVLGLVLRQSLALILSGAGVGLVGAWALTRVMAGLLFGVSATDPVTFVSIALLLIGVALLASYLPARRAAKVDPMVALRHE